MCSFSRLFLCIVKFCEYKILLLATIVTIRHSSMNPHRRFISKENIFHHNFVILKRKEEGSHVSSRNILCPVSLLYSVHWNHANLRLPELWGRTKFGNESSGTSRRFRIYRGKKTHVQIMWYKSSFFSIERSNGKKKGHDTLDVKKRCQRILYFS